MPRAELGGLTIRELCNKFLASKRTDVDLRKLLPRTFVQYSGTTNLLIADFGRERAVLDLRPEDFERLFTTLAKRHSVTTLGREVVMVRSVFKGAAESDLIDRAVKFGPRFKAPTRAGPRRCVDGSRVPRARRRFPPQSRGQPRSQVAVTRG